jgi:hypothetical protein
MSTAQVIPFPRTEPSWVPVSASGDVGTLLLFLRDELPERFPHLRDLALDVYVRRGKALFGVTAMGGFRGRRLEVECSDLIQGLLHVAKRLSEIPAARRGSIEPLLAVRPERIQ